MKITVFNCSRRSSIGVSLVELMVAMVIGLFLVLGAVTVYTNSQTTYRTSENLARLQEVGRYALDAVGADIQLAGYWGNLAFSDMATNNAAALGPTACGADWATKITVPVEGSNNSYALTCAGITPVAWSDVLVLRHAEAAPVARQVGKLQIHTQRLKATILNDGVEPADFMATGSGADTYDVSARAYYISRIAPAAVGDPVQWALRRKWAATSTTMDDQEIIRGVQDLQVRFGMDTNFDGVADVYAEPSADPIAPSGRVITIKVWVLVVADQLEGAYSDATPVTYADVTRNSGASPIMFTDGRRRMVFSKTIFVRNGRS